MQKLSFLVPYVTIMAETRGADGASGGNTAAQVQLRKGEWLIH